MTKNREIYRCTVCGNVVEVVKPEVIFLIKADAKEVAARKYCNLHGLWKGEI